MGSNGLGDASPDRRNILSVGGKGVGKTTLFQRWVAEFKPNTVPLVLHEKVGEWEGNNVEAHGIGALNRKSHLKEIVRGRVVIIDDALNLNKNYADKMLGLLSVNRNLDCSFVVSLQGLGVLNERKDTLRLFDTLIFFNGSESCTWLVKNTPRFSKEVELIRREIENLKPYEMVVYDRHTNMWHKTTNQDSQLFNDLLTQPLAKGQKLEAENRPPEGNSNSFRVELKKDRIKDLSQRGVSDGEIARELGTTVGYVRKVKSELRELGFPIPLGKLGRPRKAGGAA